MSIEAWQRARRCNGMHPASCRSCASVRASKSSIRRRWLPIENTRRANRARVPKPYAAQPDNNLLKRKGLFVSTTTPLPEEIHDAQFVDYCMGWFKPYVPLLQQLREIAAEDLMQSNISFSFWNSLIESGYQRTPDTPYLLALPTTKSRSSSGAPGKSSAN